MNGPVNANAPMAVPRRPTSVRRVWTCSYDYAHEHRWRWTARLCQHVRVLTASWLW
jgi:hypothetical protein